jgi:hypothetical protein
MANKHHVTQNLTHSTNQINSSPFPPPKGDKLFQDKTDIRTTHTIKIMSPLGGGLRGRDNEFCVFLREGGKNNNP